MIFIHFLPFVTDANDWVLFCVMSKVLWFPIMFVDLIRLSVHATTTSIQSRDVVIKVLLLNRIFVSFLNFDQKCTQSYALYSALHSYLSAILMSYGRCDKHWKSLVPRRSPLEVWGQE